MRPGINLAAKAASAVRATLGPRFFGMDSSMMLQAMNRAGRGVVEERAESVTQIAKPVAPAIAKVLKASGPSFGDYAEKSSGVCAGKDGVPHPLDAAPLSAPRCR